MSEVLALEWGRSALRGMLADVSPTSVRVRRTFVMEWPGEAVDPHVLGSSIRDELARLGISCDRTIVVLTRDDVVLRRLQIPAASAEAIPDLVGYQVRARSAVPVEQLAVDFLPFDTPLPNGGRSVVAATTGRERLQEIQAACQHAGLQLQSVGVSALASCEAIRRAEALRGRRDGDSLVVRFSDDQCEVALLDGGDLLCSHAGGIADRRDARSALAEVQRMLLAESEVVGERMPSRVWVLGIPEEGAADFYATMSERLGCEASPLRPFDALSTAALPMNQGEQRGSGASQARVARRGPSPTQNLAKQTVHVAEMPERPSDFVGLLGALLIRSDGQRETVDFLRPRQSVARSNRTPLYVGGGILAVALAIVTVYAGTLLYLRAMGRETAELRRQNDKLETLLEQGEPTLELNSSMDEWERRRVEWLSEMRIVGSALPGTERLYLKGWRLNVAGGDSVGTIQADVVAKGRSDVEALNQRLSELVGHRVRPSSIRSSARSEYPVQFQLDVDILNPTERTSNKQE